MITATTGTSLFDDLAVARSDPYTWARQEQARGGKAIGITPMHFPEELVHASGALPVTIQESNLPVTTGYDYLPVQFCGFTRSNVDAAVKEELDFFDGMILSDFCVQMRNAFNIVERHVKSPFIYVWWPPEYDYQRWLSSALSRLDRARKQIEEIVGREITDDALRESIRIYNRNRELLRSIDALRATKPGVIGVAHFQLLVQTSMLMDKEEHNHVLEGVLDTLQDAQPVTNGEARIYLSGHLCHAVRPETLELIEDVGGVVVGDDLYTGRRYYAAEVLTDVPPAEALVRRWFDPGLACPEKAGSAYDWMEDITEAVARTNAEGVISFMPKHCEPHMFYYPYVKEALTEKGIPLTMLQTEHEVLGIEGNKTRIQAMVETLKGARR